MDKQLIFDHLNSTYKACVKLSGPNAKIQDIPYDLAYSGLNNSIYNFMRLRTLDSGVFADILTQMHAPFLCMSSMACDEANFEDFMHAHGLSLLDNLTAQFRDHLNYFSYHPPREEIRIKLVDSTEDLAVLDALCQDAYNHEKGLAQKMFRGLLSQPPEESQVRMFLAYWQDQPVGKGMLSTCDQYAGLYWDSVLPTFRRRGVATALINSRLKLAQELGYKQVVMQGRSPSLSCYQRAGFKPCGSLPCFKKDNP